MTEERGDAESHGGGWNSQSDADAGVSLLTFMIGRLDAYAGAYSDFGDPVNKNRLQAISTVRRRIPLTLSDDFASARQELIGIVEDCKETFVPDFDREYGTGRGVFGLLLGELESLKSVEDCRRKK